jgi:ABC-type polysaccharide/polyol phosphate export permease
VAAPTVEPQDEYLGEHHVYTPHRVGLPQLWRRRQFVDELARSELRSQNYDTVFGQLWLVLSPLLNGFVYFLLVDILRGGKRPPEYLAHLLGGIFAWTFVSGTISQSATAVTSGGRLILNTAFPRALLPLSSVIEGFLRFLPTLVIFAVIDAVTGLPVGVELLWVIPLIAMFTLVALGLALFVAALQVYFRDLTQFLPYILRVWLYASPVLYYAEEMPDRYKWMLYANPIGCLLKAWSDVLIKGETPAAIDLATGLAWGIGLVIFGALFFMSREREFAVRL